tara:strand:- start:14726 stop:14878 length:153 start_codon:yes stop_codon:yes gene_type:complete
VKQGAAMNNDIQNPELKKANLRMAIILGCVAIASLVMAGLAVSRMMALGT